MLVQQVAYVKIASFVRIRAEPNQPLQNFALL